MQGSTGNREGDDAATELARRHTRVAVICAGVVVSMVGLSYAAVPLYRIFCQVTGYGGTPQTAARPSSVVLDKTMTVRFDANVAGGLGWRFEPTKRTMEVRIGDNVLATYRATNTTDHVLKGSASFNVSPDQAGVYFNKIECFCFTEQTLQPGQTVDMPVTFFIDPAMVSDSDVAHVAEITLSYTFYPVGPNGNGLAARRSGRGEGGS